MITNLLNNLKLIFMKRQITLLTVMFFLILMSTNATVWRVSNRVINGVTVDADFNTLQAAIDGASSGDTLYLMGSKTSYGNGVFNKQLVVIGPGYWLVENPNTQAVKDTARVGFLTFNDGSQGSQVQGLYLSYYTINQNTSPSYIRLILINTDSITILKNYLFVHRDGNYTVGTYDGVYINGNRSNIIVQQNWIEVLITDNYPGYNGYVRATIFTGIPTNCIIQNNFLRAIPSTQGIANCIQMDVIDIANDLKIYNNVIWGNFATYYTEQFNNILLSGTYIGGADLMMFNLCDGTQYPVDPPELNNLQNIDMSTVFTDYTKYIDNGYDLVPGSPAIGAGVNGGDCGVFSFDTGGYPYVLSGMPAIPAIYEATVEPWVGSTLPVTIKASSHNEHK